MPKDTFNAEELEIIRAYEAGELKPVKDVRKKVQYQQAAKHALQKSKTKGRINQHS